MMFPPQNIRGKEVTETIMDHAMVNTNKRKILILLLFVFFIFGCATVPKGPLKPDEVRLIDLKIIETGDKSGDVMLYKAIIGYQHGEKIKPENIRSACSTWTWLWKT
jgi:hypothetical protein